jgi:hypothetical protein
MHIVTRPRPEIITVDFNGKRFEVRMDGDGAFVPEDLGQHMVQRGLVGKGHHQDPAPQWEKPADRETGFPRQQSPSGSLPPAPVEVGRFHA